MKLYTKEMFLIAAEKCEVSMIDAKHIMKYIDEYVTPIELPSDEDIDMAQQTAVEWFFDKLKNHEIQAEHFELYNQAKQMEKDQIMKAVDKGYDEGCKYPEDMTLKNSEQYYNETYNK